MAIASLANFTVPLASDQSASAQGMLMPKLKYRFRLSFENFGVSTPTTELTKQVISAARPNVQFEDQTIHIYKFECFGVVAVASFKGQAVSSAVIVAIVKEWI